MDTHVIVTRAVLAFMYVFVHKSRAESEAEDERGGGTQSRRLNATSSHAKLGGSYPATQRRGGVQGGPEKLASKGC